MYTPPFPRNLQIMADRYLLEERLTAMLNSRRRFLRRLLSLGGVEVNALSDGKGSAKVLPNVTQLPFIKPRYDASPCTRRRV